MATRQELCIGGAMLALAVLAGVVAIASTPSRGHQDTGLPLITAVGVSAEHSALWGGHGEKWTPQSRLPDFSFAGYHCGEKVIPVLPVGVSVKDFGAKGDGVADDSQAFLDALAKVRSGAIEVPPGRYRITRIIEITRSNIVLRGAGPDRSVLFFPRSLNDIKPNWGATTTGQRTSNYSWSGGFLTLHGSFGSKILAGIVADAKRGDNSVRISSAEQLRVGQRVEVFQSDTTNNTLAIHLYSGDSGPVRNLKGRTRTSLVGRITSIDGDRIHIDRPLRCDVQAAWSPQLRSFEPTVTESGIENLGFEFPSQPYKGHFTELGFNAIAFGGVSDCWVRNIRILNADSGLFIGGSFNTIQGVVLESQRGHDNQNCVGHHGISLGGSDHLVTDFDFRTRYIHDITVSHHCSGNVCAHGRGVDLALDHHGYAPYENLFTDLDAGVGTRLWKCGGGADLGKHCGARGTFWNIRAKRPQRYPGKGFGPLSMNLVAVQTDQPSEKSPAGRWFEAIDPQILEPQNLHEAQLARRLATQAYETWDGRSLRKALDYLAEYAGDEEKKAWPHKEIEKAKGDWWDPYRQLLPGVLHHAARVYQDKRYDACAERILKDALDVSRLQLMLGIPIRWPDTLNPDSD